MKLKKLYLCLTLLLTAVFLLPWDGVKADELTVGDESTTNYHVPIYGNYMDTKGTHSQAIYPAAQLSALANSSVTELKFYSENANVSYGAAEVKVSMKNVDQDEITYENFRSYFLSVEDGDVVYEGAVEIVNNEMVISLASAFAYESGKNILLDVVVTTKGGYTSTSFKGKNFNNKYSACYSTTNASATGDHEQFVPKTTFTYEVASSCAKPTDLDVPAANITSSSAKVTWGNASNTILEYKESNAENWTVVNSLDATTYHTLSGLSGNTTYNVRVRNVCEGDVASGNATKSFTTLCGAESTVSAWEYGFETKTSTGSGNIPQCWSSIPYNYAGYYETTIYPYVYNSGAKSGSNALYFYGGNGDAAYIILPEFDVDLNQLTLSFYHKNSSSWYTSDSYPQFTVGYLTDLEDASTFQVLSADGNPLTRLGAYATDRTEIDLKNMPTTVKNIVIRYAGGSSRCNGYIDDIRVSRTPSCTKPATLSEATSITSEGATFTWTAGGSETQFQYACIETGETLSDGDWNTLEANVFSKMLTGLDGNTSYDFYVRAYCDENEQSDYLIKSFKTLCGTYAMPFTQDFNSLTAGIPDCWDNTKGTTTTASYRWNYWATGHDGACVRYNSYNTSSGLTDTLATPAISISEAAVLKFWWKNPAGGAYSVKIAVDGGEKADLKTGMTGQTDWKEETIDLSSDTYVGHNVVVYFCATSNCGYNDAYLYLDDVRVIAKPTCSTPTGLSKANVTVNSVDLTWTAGGTETAWNVLYKADADADYTPVAITTSDLVAGVYTLSGLAAQTHYTVKVQAHCGAGNDSEASTAVDFSTKCAAVTELPWGNDFESETADAVPDCWSNEGSVSSTVSGYYAPAEAIWAVYSYSGNKSLRMCNAYASAGTAQVTSPTITLPASPAYELSFDYAHTATCGNFKVQISTNGGSTFTDLGEYGPTVASPSSYNGGSNPETFTTDETISLSSYSGNIILRFIATANYDGGAIFIDNVNIHREPSCFAPTSLSVATSINPEGATFSWEASGHGEETYQWAVAVGSADPEWVDDEVHKVATTTKTLTGLTPGTSYKFYVRSYCGVSDQSAAIVSALFSPVLSAPTALEATDITSYEATINWTAATGVSNYEYSLREGDVFLPDWNNAIAVNGATSVDLSELQPNTTYSMWVRSVFNTSKSGNSDKLIFTTKCEAIVVSTIYTENFNSLDNNTIPDCWDNSEGTTTNAGYKWKATTGGQSGKCLMFNGVDNGYGRTNILATPIFELSSDADLVFYWKNKKTGDYKVQISVDGNAREDFITGLTGIDAWTKAEKALTDYNGHSVQLFFCGTSAYDGSANLYLDEFKITPVSCRKPASDPVVNSKTATTAEISWTAGGDNTDYQFCLAPAGTAEGDLVWDAENVVSALNKTIEGLNPVTNYDFYVRTYCDSENQSDARKVSFKTECADYVTLPFNENFDALAYQTIPECWNNDEGTSGDYYKWKAVMPISSTNYVQFNSSTNDADATNVLATPTILLGEGNLLTFKCMNPTGGDFNVQIEGEGIAREDLLTGLTGIADWTLKYVAIPAKFNNKKVQLFFCATSNAGDENAYISLDDVRVTRGEVFSDAEDNASRFTALKAAGETMDVIFNRTLLFNGDYNTLCLPFSLNEEQLADAECPLNNFKLKVYDYSAVVNDELQIAIAGASSIEAGVPYFAAYQGNVANKSLHLFKDVVISADAAGEKADGQVTYQGVLNKGVLADQTANAENPEILYLGAGNKIYWPAVEGGLTIKGFRAYFSINYSSTPSGAPVRPRMSARIVERAEVPTGCENINAEGKAVKLLENNQVVIIRNGVKYTIQGQKIQ